MKKDYSTIYLAGGCFWCTEAIFASLNGVESAIPGYMGGSTKKPTYEDVCSGTTGHAETVKVVYNEDSISTHDIIEIFFDSHDPTSLNKQGNDIGTQYRSAIFYTTPEQAEIAMRHIEEVNSSLPNGKKVVTELVPAGEFYPAEEYHKEYYMKHSNAPYCQLVISDKLERLQKKWSDKLK